MAPTATGRMPAVRILACGSLLMALSSTAMAPPANEDQACSATSGAAQRRDMALLQLSGRISTRQAEAQEEGDPSGLTPFEADYLTDANNPLDKYEASRLSRASKQLNDKAGGSAAGGVEARTKAQVAAGASMEKAKAKAEADAKTEAEAKPGDASEEGKAKEAAPEAAKPEEAEEDKAKEVKEHAETGAKADGEGEAGDSPADAKAGDSPADAEDGAEGDESAGEHSDDAEEEFDCKAGLSRWESGWSDTKKAWCCEHKEVGCEIYDCRAGFENREKGWSDAKKEFCIFDCAAGFENRELGWSDMKKEFCKQQEEHFGPPPGFEGSDSSSKDAEGSAGNASSNVTGNATGNTSGNETELVKICTTRKDPRASSFGYTTSEEGTPCVFGADARDEGEHCIMEDGKYGSFGWCWTSKDMDAWGSCSDNCPLFGQAKILEKQIDSLSKRFDESMATTTSTTTTSTTTTTETTTTTTVTTNATNTTNDTNLTNSDEAAAAPAPAAEGPSGAPAGAGPSGDKSAGKGPKGAAEKAAPGPNAPKAPPAPAPATEDMNT